MNNYKKIFPLVFFLLGANFIQAQVKFKLTQLADGKTYQVSLIPEVSFLSPMNTTSTAQVTLKTPTNGFEVDQIFNLQPDVVWEPNSLTQKPEESPEYDYVSFGLVSQGTKNITYEAGVEVPLFAFTNFLDCEGEISLIDNLNDPFSPPNSRLVNVGNQITILGAKGDAYIGNVEESRVACGANLTDVENIDNALIDLSLFPNPAKDYISLNFNWNRKAEEIKMTVLSLNGKVAVEKNMTIQAGKNQTKIYLEHLAQGNYFIQINGEDWKIISDQFIKM